MGIGAAVGGVASLVASHSASKSAERASRQSEKWLEKGYSEAEEAQSLADAYRNSIKDIQDEYGEFANGIYNEWSSLYGDFEQNLTNYYKNLTPEKYSMQMKADIERELNKQFNHFKQTAAQSGLMTTPMMLQAKKERDFKQAELNAKADIEADDKVRSMQTQYLASFGMPQKYKSEGLLGQSILTQADLENNALSQQLNTRNMMVNLATQNSNAYNASATGYGQAAGQLFGQGVNLLNRGVGQMFSSGGVFGDSEYAPYLSDGFIGGGL